jgi:hypothetical protein
MSYHYPHLSAVVFLCPFSYPPSSPEFRAEPIANNVTCSSRFMITGQGWPQNLWCGRTNSTARVNCLNNFIPVACEGQMRSSWCTLGKFDGGGNPINLYPDEIKMTHLPANVFTDPDPVPGEWSCTVQSLGRPIVWRLQTKDYFFLTAWFGHWKSDQMYSNLRFDLNSSVFSNRPGGGLIRKVGLQSGWGPEAGSLTPWLRGFDPTQTLRSVKRDSYYKPGWDFYNGLDWNVRFDAATGYMELNQSWYCDDKDPSTP